MAAPRRWRVAVLGLGHWYSAYGLARGLHEYPRAELAGVAWHVPSQLREFAAAFGVPAYDTYEDLLSRDDVDVVQIAAPVAEIPELTIQAARAGKHIVLGKPMAMTVAQADRMVEAVRASGVTCVAFQGMMRLNAVDLKRRLDRGDIGELVLMHQTSRWSIAEDWYASGTPGWFVDPAQVPGGALIDEGIYWIDCFRFLAGGEVATVEARTANLVHRDLAVEDWGFAHFTFENGVRATLEASWTITAPRVTGPSPKQNAVVRLELVGSRGEIAEQWFRDPGRAVLAAGADNWVFERHAAPPFGPGVPQVLDHLIDCVETGRPTPASIDEARAAFVVAMAAYESARSGQPVRVPRQHTRPASEHGS